jgi:hypothetical protein
MPDDSPLDPLTDFGAAPKISMLDAAKRSLREAERLEEDGASAVFGGDDSGRHLESMRDELLLGILQSNIAIAEALGRDEEARGPDECDLRDDEYGCEDDEYEDDPSATVFIFRVGGPGRS